MEKARVSGPLLLCWEEKLQYIVIYENLFEAYY